MRSVLTILLCLGIFPITSALVKSSSWIKPPASSEKKYFGHSVTGRSQQWDQNNDGPIIYLMAKYPLPAGKLEAVQFHTKPAWASNSDSGYQLTFYIFKVKPNKETKASGDPYIVGYDATVSWYTTINLTPSLTEGFYTVNLTNGPEVDSGNLCGFGYESGINLISYDYYPGSTSISGSNAFKKSTKQLSTKSGSNTARFDETAYEYTFSFGVIIDVYPDVDRTPPVFTTESVAFNVGDTSTWPWWMPVVLGVGGFLVVVLFLGLAVVIHRCTSTGDNTDAIVKAISESMMAGMQASMMNQALAASFDPNAPGQQPPADGNSDSKSNQQSMFIMDQLNDVTKDGYDVNVVIELNRPAGAGKDGKFIMKKKTGPGVPASAADDDYDYTKPAAKPKKKKKKVKKSSHGEEEEQDNDDENVYEPDSGEKKTFMESLSSLFSFGKKSSKSKASELSATDSSTGGDGNISADPSQFSNYLPALEAVASGVSRQGSGLAPSESVRADADQASEVAEDEHSGKKKKKKKKKAHGDSPDQEDETGAKASNLSTQDSSTRQGQTPSGLSNVSGLIESQESNVEGIVKGKSSIVSKIAEKLSSTYSNLSGHPSKLKGDESRAGESPSGLSNISGLLESQESNVEGLVGGKASNASRFSNQESAYSTNPSTISAQKSKQKKSNLQQPSGISNTASGLSNTASGLSNTASGLSNTASGLSNTASGLSNTASGYSNAGSGLFNNQSRTGESPSGLSNVSGLLQSEESNVEGLVAGKSSNASRFSNQESAYSANPSTISAQKSKQKKSNLQQPSGISNTASGLSNTASGLSNTASGLSNTASGYSNAGSGLLNNQSRTGESPSGLSNVSGLLQSEESNVEGLVGGKASNASKYSTQQSNYSAVSAQPSEQKGKPNKVKKRKGSRTPSETSSIKADASGIKADASGISGVGSNVSGYSNVISGQDSNRSGIVPGKASNASSFGGAVGSSISGMPSNLKGTESGVSNNYSTASETSTKGKKASNTKPAKGSKLSTAGSSTSQGSYNEMAKSGASLSPSKSKNSPSSGSVSSSESQSGGKPKKMKKKTKSPSAKDSNTGKGNDSRLSAVASSNDQSFSDFAASSAVDWPTQKK